MLALKTIRRHVRCSNIFWNLQEPWRTQLIHWLSTACMMSVRPFRACSQERSRASIPLECSWSGFSRSSTCSASTTPSSLVPESTSSSSLTSGTSWMSFCTTWNLQMRVTTSWKSCPSRSCGTCTILVGARRPRTAWTNSGSSKSLSMSRRPWRASAHSRREVWMCKPRSPCSLNDFSLTFNLI